MACLKGYIEVFDAIKFTSKGRWHDQINPGRKSPELDNNSSFGEASLYNSLIDQIGSPVTVDSNEFQTPNALNKKKISFLKS